MHSIPSMHVTISFARFPEQLDAVVSIFREYVASPTVSLDFQDFEAEFANLPGKYAQPGGCVLLALQESIVVGCAALRPVDQISCELKRVYVRPKVRGNNVGRDLVVRMLGVARAAGYSRMCLDVLPEFVAAQRLYESLGFLPAPAVTHNPVPGTKFMAIEL
jgi:GNAT superfamily N-acetyltransferase